MKTKIVLPIIIVALVIIVIILVAIYLLSNSGKETKTDSTPINVEVPAEVASTTNIITTSPDDIVMGIYKDSVLRSTDNGLNFENYFKIATSSAEMGLADVLGLEFHPEIKNRLTVSTYDDGLFLNEDGINEWIPVTFPPKQIYSFILDYTAPDTKAFTSGVVSGNGRIFRTEDKGASWRAVYSEPGLKTFVSALVQNPKVNENLIAGTSAGTVVRSLDGGDTWKNIGKNINGYISDIIYDSSKQSFLYLLIKQGKIYHSVDGGLSWLNWEEEKTKEIKALNAKASELTKAKNKEGAAQAKAAATAIQERNKTEKAPSGSLSIVADPKISGTVYLSTTKGIYKSIDYGKYWKPLDIIESAMKFPIPSLAISPNNSNEISFVAGKTFYRSINSGVTWAITPLDNSRNASLVAYDPFDPTIIYIGMSAKQ